MTPIKPEIKLFTDQDADSISIHIDSLIIVYRGNYYHLQGGTRDTIHVFRQSIALYVLNVNKSLGRMALNAYMVPQPDPINAVHMHTPQEIIEHLGSDWEQLPPKTIVEKLMNYLY